MQGRYQKNTLEKHQKQKLETRKIQILEKILCTSCREDSGVLEVLAEVVAPQAGESQAESGARIAQTNMSKEWQ